MNLEKILIALFGISILMLLYHSPQTFKSISEMLNSGDFIYNYSYILYFCLYYWFSLIGIYGAYLYTQNNNIFNPYLKAYFIYDIFLFIINIPRTIYYVSGAETLNLTFFFYQIIGLTMVVLAFFIYSNEKIRVKPTPVQATSTRFYHFFIDAIFLILIGLQSANSFYWLDSFVEPSPLRFLLILLSPYIYYLFYYWLSESIFQQTLGKLVTKKYVRRIDGQPTNAFTILGRTLSRFIPFEPFSYLGGSATGWHDTLSNTNVFERSEILEDGILEHLIMDDKI